MTAKLIPLGPGDEARVDAFLARHADTTMFMRSNLRRAGLVDGGAPYEATWVAAIAPDDDAIVGVAAHAWNGVILVQAEEALADLARTAVAMSGREVVGAAGPSDQVEQALDAVGLQSAPRAVSGCDVLMALELRDLRIPAPLARGAWACRQAREEDLDVLVPWRRAYEVEALALTRAQARARVTRRRLREDLAEGALFALTAEDGALCSMSAFNARVPGCVQIGGVYTPPELRGRGYGRAVVAGSLQLAGAQGVTRSVLFAERTNHAAQAAYAAIGYVHRGAYGVVMLRHERMP